MRDYIFKPKSASEGGVDRTDLKKSIAGLLGDRMVNDKAKYLFSSEPLIQTSGEWFRLRTMDDVTIPGMHEITVPTCRPGDAVVLSSWVALTGDAFRADLPREVLANHWREKLRVVAELKFKDAVAISTIDVSPTVGVMKALSKKQRLCRPYGHVTVIGTVLDPDLLNEIKTTGVGSAKAYGFGLVVSQPQ